MAPVNDSFARVSGYPVLPYIQHKTLRTILSQSQFILHVTTKSANHLNKSQLLRSQFKSHSHLLQNLLPIFNQQVP